ncbi:MAG TPA: carboxypeptidase-like regulatory domain-containing protein [Phnomibacter sp.]|nr:carboxypeptidase-like regulatory domain-containing protein [Phnomibacter sp.]
MQALKSLVSTLVLLWFFSMASKAQYTLQGTVRTADGKPVPNASVFFSNTSFGTAANAEGHFALYNIPTGRYELVVSSMGFETRAMVISTEQFAAPLVITLQPKAAELDEVVIESYDKETWEKWGKFFIENFMGTTPEAMQCTLKNTKAIRFRHYKKRQKLVAIADEPLLIENRALGYRISYQMELFEYDFKNKIVYYAGYPLFSSLEKPGKQPREKWLANRNKSYYGSKMHFMRSLYRNTLAEEGFEMHHMQEVPNAEKERVRQLYKPNTSTAGPGIVISMSGNQAQVGPRSNGDSAAYYRSVMRQPDMLTLVDSARLTGDSIAYAVDETTAAMYFPHQLLVKYLRGAEDALYLQQTLQNREAGPPVSHLRLVHDKPIEVLANGAYFEPLDLLAGGYWSWSDKMGNMLPFDFKPTAPPKR